MKNTLLAVLLAGSALVAQAQTLTSAKMNPAEIKAGEKSTLTATFEVKDNTVNCGVRVNYGDGSPEVSVRLKEAKDDYVSVTGITGERTQLPPELLAGIERVNIRVDHAGQNSGDINIVRPQLVADRLRHAG